MHMHRVSRFLPVVVLAIPALASAHGEELHESGVMPMHYMGTDGSALFWWLVTASIIIWGVVGIFLIVWLWKHNTRK
jgi:uncharacterized membrane protein